MYARAQAHDADTKTPEVNYKRYLTEHGVEFDDGMTTHELKRLCVMKNAQLAPRRLGLEDELAVHDITNALSVEQLYQRMVAVADARDTETQFLKLKCIILDVEYPFMRDICTKFIRQKARKCKGTVDPLSKMCCKCGQVEAAPDVEYMVRLSIMDHDKYERQVAPRRSACVLEDVRERMRTREMAWERMLRAACSIVRAHTARAAVVRRGNSW